MPYQVTIITPGPDLGSRDRATITEYATLESAKAAYQHACDKAAGGQDPVQINLTNRQGWVVRSELYDLN